MKALKLLAGALLVCAAGMLMPCAPAAAQQSAPAVNQPPVAARLVVVDVDQPLNTTGYKLVKGDVIIFARKTGTVGSNVTVDQRQMLCAQCINMKPVQLFTSPQGYDVIIALSANVSGFQLIDITHKANAPYALPHTVTIKVMVQ